MNRTTRVSSSLVGSRPIEEESCLDSRKRRKRDDQETVKSYDIRLCDSIGVDGEGDRILHSYS